ncbi:hypothetical protein ACOMHN_021029 [Nucella lapillus]
MGLSVCDLSVAEAPGSKALSTTTSKQRSPLSRPQGEVFLPQLWPGELCRFQQEDSTDGPVPPLLANQALGSRSDLSRSHGQDPTVKILLPCCLTEALHRVYRHFIVDIGTSS